MNLSYADDVESTQLSTSIPLNWTIYSGCKQAIKSLAMQYVSKIKQICIFCQSESSYTFLITYENTNYRETLTIHKDYVIIPGIYRFYYNYRTFIYNSHTNTFYIIYDIAEDTKALFYINGNNLYYIVLFTGKNLDCGENTLTLTISDKIYVCRMPLMLYNGISDEPDTCFQQVPGELGVCFQQPLIIYQSKEFITYIDSKHDDGCLHFCISRNKKINDALQHRWYIYQLNIPNLQYTDNEYLDLNAEKLQPYYICEIYGHTFYTAPKICNIIHHNGWWKEISFYISKYYAEDAYKSSSLYITYDYISDIMLHGKYDNISDVCFDFI